MWRVKLLKRRPYITYDWFFQALFHRYCGALFAAIEAQRDHSDSCPEKRLWFVGFSVAAVSLWNANINLMLQYSHSIHFYFNMLLLLFLVPSLPLYHFGSELSLHNIQSPHCYYSGSPWLHLGPWVQLQEQVWSDVALLRFPMCEVPKPATFPPDTCTVMWYLSPAALSFPLLCVLRDLLWSFAVPSGPPESLLLPFFSCYVFVMICAANLRPGQSCDVAKRKGWPPTSGDAQFGNPADCISKPQGHIPPPAEIRSAGGWAWMGQWDTKSLILPSTLFWFLFLLQERGNSCPSLTGPCVNVAGGGGNKHWGVTSRCNQVDERCRRKQGGGTWAANQQQFGGI